MTAKIYILFTFVYSVKITAWINQLYFSENQEIVWKKQFKKNLRKLQFKKDCIRGRSFKNLSLFAVQTAILFDFHLFSLVCASVEWNEVFTTIS